ncbi:hypothetical protein M0812_29459 [Anaeramoeba flamelloides]|uniref:Uncharacterized protein n=1 Tax=Anaeramoeba flamelloides TaxID=1746091 RepID=A0AAV7Y6E7_9EUKA|nr:hypothetical protein M0812_29459 [Anaeramoeba flamelloides]
MNFVKFGVEKENGNENENENENENVNENLVYRQNVTETFIENLNDSRSSGDVENDRFILIENNQNHSSKLNDPETYTENRDIFILSSKNNSPNENGYYNDSSSDNHDSSIIEIIND